MLSFRAGKPVAPLNLAMIRPPVEAGARRPDDARAIGGTPPSRDADRLTRRADRQDRAAASRQDRSDRAPPDDRSERRLSRRARLHVDDRRPQSLLVFRQGRSVPRIVAQGAAVRRGEPERRHRTGSGLPAPLLPRSHAHDERVTAEGLGRSALQAGRIQARHDRRRAQARRHPARHLDGRNRIRPGRPARCAVTWRAFAPGNQFGSGGRPMPGRRMPTSQSPSRDELSDIMGL